MKIGDLIGVKVIIILVSVPKKLVAGLFYPHPNLELEGHLMIRRE